MNLDRGAILEARAAKVVVNRKIKSTARFALKILMAKIRASRGKAIKTAKTVPAAF
ncbi:hypothetical protein [Caballeronia catudaia]|uniref:hypothetical protein n=1 Tax=Caballeronia catudaia TaxID=1777136 RepID=UPI00135A9072|nr:hypothetical protein [Caballeronia catudaia]